MKALASRRVRRLLLPGIVLSVVGADLQAQASVIIQGRAEDAVTNSPLPGVSIASEEYESETLTDAYGNFELELADNGGIVIYAEGLGYESQRFELPAGIGERPVILRLQPLPVQLQEITVLPETETEREVNALQQSLERRRRSYFGSVRVFDRQWINRFGPPGGTVMELITRQNPRLSRCMESSGLCTPARAPTSYSLPATTADQVMVCLDGRLSSADELASLPLESVTLVEFMGRNRVNAYTMVWFVTRVREDRLRMPSLLMGC